MNTIPAPTQAISPEEARELRLHAVAVMLAVFGISSVVVMLGLLMTLSYNSGKHQIARQIDAKEVSWTGQEYWFTPRFTIANYYRVVDHDGTKRRVTCTQALTKKANCSDWTIIFQPDYGPEPN